jgi:predicted RNA-binding Zn-ribbon protein involved in translation (DUF1610 family)
VLGLPKTHEALAVANFFKQNKPRQFQIQKGVPVMEGLLGDPAIRNSQVEDTLEMEDYARRAQYAPGTIGFQAYEEQLERVRTRELPDLLEDPEDIRQSQEKCSRKANCYLGWKLARAWEGRHYTARSASELLQEAIRAELERTPLPRKCPNCGSLAYYRGKMCEEIGFADLLYDVYTCGTCNKSHKDDEQEGYSGGSIDPRAIEEYEMWRHRNGIVWVDDDKHSPAYSEALKGFKEWLNYEDLRLRGDLPNDPNHDLFRSAYAGKRRWDDFMAQWVEHELWVEQEMQSDPDFDDDDE